MIVAYNPLSQKQQEDTDATIKELSTSADPGTTQNKWPKTVKKNLRNPFSATTDGEQNLPSEIAPLTFSENEPESDQMGKQEKPWDRLNNYFDKRARARYVSF